MKKVLLGTGIAIVASAVIEIVWGPLDAFRKWVDNIESNSATY